MRIRSFPNNHATSRSKGRKTLLGLTVALIITVSFVSFWYVDKYQTLGNQGASFEYQLNADSLYGTCVQGGAVTVNITVAYLQGTPQTVNLSANSGISNATYSFSNQTGKPSVNNPFVSTLKIDVPTTEPSNNYAVNITASSPNNRTYSQAYNLTVLNSKIIVSGSVDLSGTQDIYPSEIQFTDLVTNENYTSYVDFLHFDKPDPQRGLIQQGTYNVTLPNQHSFKVTCYWVSFYDNYTLPVPKSNGQIDFGTILINCGAGSSNVSKDYTA